MAVATCPDCGGKVSTKAAACPHCGCPVSAEPQLGVPTTKTEASEDKSDSLYLPLPPLAKQLVFTVVPLAICIPALFIYHNLWGYQSPGDPRIATEVPANKLFYTLSSTITLLVTYYCFLRSGLIERHRLPPNSHLAEWISFAPFLVPLAAALIIYLFDLPYSTGRAHTDHSALYFSFAAGVGNIFFALLPGWGISSLVYRLASYF